MLPKSPNLAASMLPKHFFPLPGINPQTPNKGNTSDHNPCANNEATDGSLIFPLDLHMQHQLYVSCMTICPMQAPIFHVQAIN